MEAVQGKTYTGQVKTFSSPKGYGFIKVKGIKSDIFVHYSAIREEGFRQLFEGEWVTFEVTRSEKGLHAENVYRSQHASAGD